MLEQAQIRTAEVDQLARGLVQSGRKREKRHDRGHPDRDTRSREHGAGLPAAKVGDDQREHDLVRSTSHMAWAGMAQV